MKLLCISTSSNCCSVALLEEEHLIKQLDINDEKTHSEKLMPLVSELFETCNTSLEEIDLLICDKGPGSFTGVRIGLSSIKALAQTQNLPIVLVSSLDSLAYHASAKEDEIICPIIDARNDQVYSGFFDCNYQLQGDYLADSITTVIQTLQSKFLNQKIIFVGNGANQYQTLLTSTFGNFASFSKNHNFSAFCFGKCGITKYKLGLIDTADSAKPMYLRPSRSRKDEKS